jgi:hypothetical protein
MTPPVDPTDQTDSQFDLRGTVRHSIGTRFGDVLGDHSMTFAQWGTILPTAPAAEAPTVTTDAPVSDVASPPPPPPPAESPPIPEQTLMVDPHHSRCFLVADGNVAMAKEVPWQMCQDAFGSETLLQY